MTTLAWIFLILILTLFTVDSIIILDNDDTDITALICGIMVMIISLSVGFGIEIGKVKATNDITKQYIPKVKCTMIDLTTFKLDTIYYLKKDEHTNK